MSPQPGSAAKVVLVFVAVFFLAIIAIACTFFYEFLQAYKTELNRALFYTLLCFGGLILLAFASATVYGVALLVLHYQSKRLYNLERQQTLQAVCNTNRLFEVTANQIAAGQIYLTEQRTEQGTVRFKSLPRQPKFPLESPLALPEPEPQELKTTLLADISDCQRLLIVGASGTGKTSLLLHIAQDRQQHGDLIILDSNGKKGKWGLYPVIGLGYNHQAIKEELLRLNEVLKSRFDEYAFGDVNEREHPLITIIADEWHIISTEIKDLADLIRPILTQGRKLSMDLIVGSNGATAKSLGLAGEMDLVNNFEAILRLSKVKDNRLVAVDFGEGEVLYQHCGAFHSPLPSHHPTVSVSQEFQNTLNNILNNPVIQDDLIREQKIIAGYHQLKAANAFSLNQLALLVFGKKGGTYTDQLKAVLKANNLSF